MTVDEVEKRVARIAAMAGDPEAAHSEEDQLHLDVLLAIAGGSTIAYNLAKAAVKTMHIDFPRWTA